MSFDPRGTAPGLMPEAKPEPKVQHMKCRNQNCSSIQAVEISTGSSPEGAGAAHNRLYQCVACKHTWTLGVGGAVSL